MSKEPVLEEVPLEQDDGSKSFTPCIKYKKLAFKVRQEEQDWLEKISFDILIYVQRYRLLVFYYLISIFLSN